MNKHRGLPILIVAIACWGASLMTVPQHMPTPELRAGSHATVNTEAMLAAANDFTNVTQDITLHAFWHLDNPIAVETNPSGLPEWNPNWELRWQDFATADGRVARVYHATWRQNSSIRFTVTANSKNPAEQVWVRAQ